MSELTKELFEKHFNDVTTRLDKIEGKVQRIEGKVQTIEGKVNGIEGGMVNKEVFDKAISKLATTEALDDKIDSLARMVQDGFHDIQTRLDVTDRVQVLEKDMGRIKGALNIP
jgi:tetrahydromethanopterin S-methyltransferase subunit G